MAIRVPVFAVRHEDNHPGYPKIAFCKYLKGAGLSSVPAAYRAVKVTILFRCVINHHPLIKVSRCLDIRTCGFFADSAGLKPGGHRPFAELPGKHRSVPS